MPELRRDPIIGRWVIIASERSARPSDYKIPEPPPEDVSKCPFCSGNEAMTPSEILAYYDPGRLPNAKGWWLRVIPNKYPALKVEGEDERSADGMYDRMNGIGAHEVIVETPNHFETMAEMENKRVEDIFWAFRDRMLDLRKDKRFQYVLVFKNHGRPAGATLSHPHSQLIALPMVPIRVMQEMKGAKAYFEYKERCVFCDIIHEERAVQKRLVAENESFICVTPYASRFPYETWIIPKVHYCHYESIKKGDITLLAQMMKTVWGKYRALLKDPPLNLTIHTTPMRDPDTPYYHWHIEIMPKLTHVAGFEVGSGFYINSTPPELAAELLRKA